MPRSLTPITLAVGVPYLVALAAVALWPTPVDAPYTAVIDSAISWLTRHGLEFVDYGTIESAANIVLFVPFGLLVALHLRPRWSWVTVLLGAALSGAIETAQLVLLSARFASLDDVAMNTLGAALGTGAGVLLRWWLLTRERRRAEEQDLAFAHIPLRGASGVLGDRPVRRP